MQQVQLSIIIVNYNVRHFLEQTIWSAQLAARNLAHEIWVVDNHSSDDSVAMVRERFPEVRLIVNRDNPGFSRANNQAIRQARGRYILLLNPDTLVGEDTFATCYEFMESHPKAGALGVRMLDGSGRFLPESKRGFPTPFVAFCKAFGLSALFPRSRWLNHYHLGFLPEGQTHSIEVLSGAFMWMRQEALLETGLLDESFFMYGEDIDLSYRLVQAGWQNYYLPATAILHYKGESTRKGSLNYVRVFYRAMIIFARKHFQGQQARFFIVFLQLAIYLRAAMTLLASWARRAFLPVVDALVLFGGLYGLKDFWGIYHFETPAYFGRSFLLFNAPLYTGIWLLSLYFNGAYDQGSNVRRITNGILTGTLIIAAIYGFLDLEYRSSRMLILLGTFWALFGLTLYRGLLAWWADLDFTWRTRPEPRLIIVGSPAAAEQVQSLLGRVQRQKNLLGLVTPTGLEPGQWVLGSEADLETLVARFRANELIFSLQDILPSRVIALMDQLGPGISYRTLVPDASSIIGSSSKNSTGELYTLDTYYQLSEPLRQRSKRVLDVAICMLTVIAWPVLYFRSDNSVRCYRNWWAVLLGRKTWVGYFSNPVTAGLPPLRQSVFDHTPGGLSLSEKNKQQLDYLYARDYQWSRDLQVLRYQLLQRPG